MTRAEARVRTRSGRLHDEGSIDHGNVEPVSSEVFRDIAQAFRDFLRLARLRAHDMSSEEFRDAARTGTPPGRLYGARRGRAMPVPARAS